MRGAMDAVLALLRAIDPDHLPVVLPDQLDDDISQRPQLYVVVFDQTPMRRDPTLTGRGQSVGATFAVQHVGTTTGEVRDSVTDTQTALQGVRLTVAGRVSTPLKWISGSQILPDSETRNPRLYTATDVWRCAFTS